MHLSGLKLQNEISYGRDCITVFNLTCEVFELICGSAVVKKPLVSIHRI